MYHPQQRKTQDLNEAAELWELLDAHTHTLEDWTDRAHGVMKSEVVWDTLDTAKAQVRIYGIFLMIMYTLRYEEQSRNKHGCLRMPGLKMNFETKIKLLNINKPKPK